MKDDRWFWLTVRRALLMVVRAIEQRYGVGEKVNDKASEQ